MKKILAIILPLALIFQSCDKDDAELDGIDLSTSIPPYVELTSTAAKTVKQGTSTTVSFQMRVAMQQAVTITYNVTGAVTLTNQTVVIDRNKLTATATVAVPNNAIVAPATSATATLTLVKAAKADGGLLTIGAKNEPATQKVTINITP
ncbi:MAG: hypothetical protein WDN26_24095 [Chitinophagaceae bacterium]